MRVSIARYAVFVADDNPLWGHAKGRNVMGARKWLEAGIGPDIFCKAGRSTANIYGQGTSPLIQACKNADDEMVELLLRWKATPNFWSAHYSGPPLSAVLIGDFSWQRRPTHPEVEIVGGIVDRLLAVGADIKEDTYAGEDARDSSLRCAIARRDLSLVRKTLEAGAQPNLFRRDLPGVTENVFLEFARGNVPMFQLLLEFGAQPRPTSPGFAAYRGRERSGTSAQGQFRVGPGI